MSSRSICQIHSTTRALSLPLCNTVGSVLHHPSPPASPPLSFSAPKAKHLFLADGKLELHRLNKYIPASKNCFWWKKGRERGEEIKGSGRGEQGGVGQIKKVPSGNVWKKSKGTSSGWCWLPPFRSSPSGPRLLMEVRFGVPAPADPQPPVDTRHTGGAVFYVRVCPCVIETLSTQIR